MKNENECGLIYGLTNKYFPGMVKIGATRSLDISKRMNVLGTAVPEPFVCAFAYKVPQDVLFNIEHTLHDTFAYCRTRGSEFFKVDPSKVDNLLRQLGKFDPMQSAVQDVINAEDAKRKAPNMDFIAMGLPVGAVLRFKNDTSITCTIIDNKRVSYNGQTTSLSKLTQQLLGLSYGVQPSPYWLTEDGCFLIDIYKEYTRAHVADARAQCRAAAKNAKMTADAFRRLSSKCQQLINDTNHG
jgi:hypothetical protein